MRISRTTLIIITLSIVAVIAIWLFSELQRAQTPRLQLINFNWSHHYSGSPYISLSGTVYNPTQFTANNISLVIHIYVEGVSPHGWYFLESKVVNLGSVSGNSSKYFSKIVSYTGSIHYTFRNITYNLFWSW